MARTRGLFFKTRYGAARRWVIVLAGIGLLAASAGARPGRGRPKPKPGEPAPAAPQDDPGGRTDDPGLFPGDEPARGFPGGGGTGAVPDQVAAWTIVISAVSAENPGAGQAALDQVRLNGLPEARLEVRGRGQFVVVGRFGDPTADAVQRELRRVRSIQVDGRLPYLFSFLAPPTQASLTGSNPQHDLRLAKQLFGRGALYTLQVGIYGRPDRGLPTSEELREFRRAAERAAAQLRADGEAAFYYHDTYRSSVTVGIFGVRDHDPSVRPALESFNLTETRARFPNNLLNGAAIRERVRNSSGRLVERLQASVLVAIPDED